MLTPERGVVWNAWQLARVSVTSAIFCMTATTSIGFAQLVGQAGFDFLDLEVVPPSISLLEVGLELGNY